MSRLVIRRYNIHHQKFSMVNFNHLLNNLIFCTLILYMSACGISRETTRTAAGSESIAVPTSSPVSDSERVVLSHLRSAYDDWGGAPYLLGGSSKSGVDCSAFTKSVLDEYFEVDIPRHSRDQLQAGSSVRRNSIRPGDLIFFRTGKGVLHVGLAMENGDFLHASYSSGVMISNVGERYWAGKFLGARRVF